MPAFLRHAVVHTQSIRLRRVPGRKSHGCSLVSIIVLLLTTVYALPCHFAPAESDVFMSRWLAVPAWAHLYSQERLLLRILCHALISHDGSRSMIWNSRSMRLYPIHIIIIIIMMRRRVARRILQMPLRRRCMCLCGCRKRPGRRLECEVCGHRFGPGCCMTQDLDGYLGRCHVCSPPPPGPTPPPPPLPKNTKRPRNA